ncbi:hypothetical protein ACFQZX_10300 [Mucilaginibacter litoreus]|uniref:Uncharacterized protein n=1 Tax=Mucilaginibacter litoreus TaxID=1048221 RepID=A0ABW3ATZ5_9SPHI
MPNPEKQLQYWQERARRAEEALRADQRSSAGLKAYINAITR